MEKHIHFLSDNFTLEGLLHQGSGGKGMVVTHPHPLYGGNLDNPVVDSVVQVFQEKGYTTLRFNFRGVGGSEGSHDGGNGEQTDVASAVSFLRDTGIEHIDLAGYSFGSWINAKWVHHDQLAQNLIMIAPPVASIDFQVLSPLPSLRLVVTGSNDHIAPPDQIQALMPQWNPHAILEVIEGGDHFYSGTLAELKAILGRFE